MELLKHKKDEMKAKKTEALTAAKQQAGEGLKQAAGDTTADALQRATVAAAAGRWPLGWRGARRLLG